MNKHILITGYPRSGTTLILNMMTACLPWGCADQEVRAKMDMKNTGDRISKRPYDIMNREEIMNVAKECDKDLRVILCARDPRDILASRHPNLPGEYFVHPEYSWRLNDGKWVKEGPGLLDMWEAFQWWGNALLTSNARYDAVVGDPDSLQKQIGSTFGIQDQWDGIFSTYHERPNRHAITSNEMATGPIIDRTGMWLKKKEDEDHVLRLLEEYPEMNAMIEWHGYSEVAV